MYKIFLPTIVAALLVAGCGSLPGGLGDILGSSSPTQQSDVRGTVVTVDTQRQTITMDVAWVNNLRDSRTGSVIHYDSNTTVEYQGRTYRPEDLERGDEISVIGRNESGRYIATRITVTRNIRG